MLSIPSAGGGRVDLVPLPPATASPQDLALAAVICSALATVLLALLVLGVIYCKRQLVERKPSGGLVPRGQGWPKPNRRLHRCRPGNRPLPVSAAASLRSGDCPESGAELSCLESRWMQDLPEQPYCQAHLGPRHTCGTPGHTSGPVHLCCSLTSSRDTSALQSQLSLSRG